MDQLYGVEDELYQFLLTEIMFWIHLNLYYLKGLGQEY